MTAVEPGAHRLHEDEPAVGHLVLDVSRSPLSPHLARRRVAVTIDELPLTVPWGRTEIALPPGRHPVEIAVDGGAGWGRVADAVPVAAGHRVEVYYRAPAVPVRRGALGPVPQATGGVAAFVVLAALAVLVLVLGVGVVAALALV